MIQNVIQELMDSKRFTELFKQAGTQWSKRALTQEDKARLLEPIVEMILSKVPRGNALPQELRNDVPVHTPRTDAAVLARKPDPGSIVIMDDASELPFDPFKQPEAQASEAQTLSKPLVEPSMVGRRQQMVNMLRDTLSKLPHQVGQKITFVMPMDWNVTEAPVFFDALGTHVLAQNAATGSFGTRMAPDKSGWEVTAIRMK